MSLAACAKKLRCDYLVIGMAEAGIADLPVLQRAVDDGKLGEDEMTECLEKLTALDEHYIERTAKVLKDIERRLS